MLPGLATAAFVAATLTAAALLRGPLGDSNHERFRNSLRYTPNVAIMRVVAGGHRSSLADWIWLKALPDIAPDPPGEAMVHLDPEQQRLRKEELRAAKKRWLDGVFDLVTSLEPGFRTVYQFGSTFLGFLEEEADSAIALLERGVTQNPDDILLRVDLAMAWYMYRSDVGKTIEHLRVAAEHPDCDAFTLAFLTSLEVREKEDVPAIMKWLYWLESPSDEVREKAEWCLGKAKLQIAFRALREFEELYGRPPKNSEELRRARLVDAEVEEVVLADLVITEDGRPHYQRFEELQSRRQIRDVELWARQFRDERGRWPTEADLGEAGFVSLPAAPDGQSYRLIEGEVELR